MSSRFSGLAAVAWRESRTARRRLLLYMSSIILGVAALVAIDSFAENATETVHEQARTLLGGDIALNARDSFSTPITRLFDSLSSAGVGVGRQTTFASMVVGSDTGATRLVQVRAVTEKYPFYGVIETEPAAAFAGLQRSPSAVADVSLLVALGLRVGDTIALGAARFVVRGTIVSVPGEVAAAASLGPRLYIANRYVADTHLLVFGSRAETEALIKLPASLTTGQFRGRFGAQLAKERVRLQTVAQNEEQLNDAIDQLRNFLSVVGLVALLLGGVGVASGVNAFVMGKIDTVAILRCLGATSAQVVIIYVLQAAAMGLIGAAAGTILGIMAQFALPHALSGLLPQGIVVRVAPQAALMGLAVGLWVAVVFSLRPLLGLRGVSPLQALRRETDAAVLRRVRRDSSAAVVSFAIVASVFGLTLTRSDRWQDAVGFGIAVFLAVGALWMAAATLAWSARRVVRPRWPFVLRQSVASLYRPGNQTRTVVLSLGFGVFLMSTLYQIQTNLLKQLDIRLAALHANIVFFDVKGLQADTIAGLILASHSQLLQRVPIVNVRIASINGRDASTVAQQPGVVGGGERGRGGRQRDAGQRGRIFLREWRATYSDTLDSSESIVAGRWFTAANDTTAQVSIDSAIAGRLRLRLGDAIVWTVQGVSVSSRVTSFRNVDRTRLQPTFPIIFSPHALDGAPTQWVLLGNAPDARAVALLQREVAKRFPTVASLDLTVVQHTIGLVLAKVTTAIRFMGLISLFLAIPVLFSAVAATRRERLREAVLFKTLGATRRQVGRILIAEYLLLGALGSLAGVLLSVGGAWALAHFIFKVAFAPAIVPALGVSVGMTMVAVSIGLLTSHDVFATTPMAALRES
ncbi:MAG: FtsX-like permease family protein [bacterium]